MISNLHTAKHLDGTQLKEEDIQVGLVVNILVDGENIKCRCAVNDADEIIFDKLSDDWPTTYVMKKNTQDLSLADFSQLSDALKNSVMPGLSPTANQLDIINRACELGYARNNTNTKPGWTDKGIARFSNLMIEDDLNGTFESTDGYLLSLKIAHDNTIHWTDGDLVFETDENGLPIDDVNELLQGNLTVYLPLELQINSDAFNVSALFNVYIDEEDEIASPIFEVHFPDDMIKQDVSSLVEVKEIERALTDRFINKGSKSGSTTLVSKDKDDIVKSVIFKIREPNIELGFFRHDLNEPGHVPTM